MRLSSLLDALPDSLAVRELIRANASNDPTIRGLRYDSRHVSPGDLFVALRGANSDGHDYLERAIAAGAAALVVEEAPSEAIRGSLPVAVVPDSRRALAPIATRFYGHPASEMTLVGVTGTNGKTTVTHLVRSILDANDQPCGVVGTCGYAFEDVRLTPHGGVWEPEETDPTEGRESTAPGWLAPYKGKYEVPNTTPNALQCQQLMAGMLDNGAEATAMEVSSVALDQGRTECVDFDVAVFTNLTRDHLDYHGTMEQYRESKAKLFRTLVDAERQRAVINLDEPEPERGRREGEGAANDDDDDAEGDDADASSDAASDAASDAPSSDASSDSTSDAAFFIAAAGGGDRVPVVTYATQKKFEREADVFVEKAELTLFETTLTIRTPAGSIDAACGVVGELNVSNVCAAVATGVALGIPLDVIQAGVEAMRYRFQWNFPIIFSRHDPNKLYTFSNHVHMSTNEGQSWELLSPDLTRNDPDKLVSSGGPITQDNTGVEYYCTIFAANESPLKEGLLWVGSDDGLIHISRDGGQNWENVTPPNMPEWSMVNSIDPSYQAIEATRKQSDTVTIAKPALAVGWHWAAC